MNNPELQRAWQIIENTGTHLFLTGKAGTGKTTFLRNLKKESPKRTVIVAPTGIDPLLFPTAICTFHPRYHVQYRTKTFPVQQRKN